MLAAAASVVAVSCKAGAASPSVWLALASFLLLKDCERLIRRSFAYEDLPLPPLTGYREIDLTIEDIHKAFVKGDAMGPQGPPS